MAERKISISFKEKYLPVYHYLQQLREQKENVSDYICKLVERDMHNEPHHLPLEDIRKIVHEILQSNGSATTNSAHVATTKQNHELADEDIALLNQLF